ncbi:MAG: endonuclease/exonuclease/phosphatase family protein [Cyanobacteria bacterium P01_H01_bin.152]
MADVNGKPVRLVVAHPLAPVSIDNFGHRHEAMAALAAYAVQQPITMVIMGDFNLTSRSFYFRDFIRQSRLRRVNLGHGLKPTWCYDGAGRSLSHLEQVKQMFKIPIEHIFVSQDVSVDQVITPASSVSDHRPAIARLRMI